MTDDTILEWDEKDPAGLYLFAWYVALHFDDFKNKKIMHDTLVGETSWTEIINHTIGDVGLSYHAIVWEARSGGLTHSVWEVGDLISGGLGTYDPLDTTYDEDGHDLSLLRSEAKSQLESVEGKYTPGNLTNDPKLRLFFEICKAHTGQIVFPDQTVMNIHCPKEDGILLYNIERYGQYKTSPQPVFQVLMEQATRQLAEIAKSDSKDLEWALLVK